MFLRMCPYTMDGAKVRKKNDIHNSVCNFFKILCNFVKVEQFFLCMSRKKCIFAPNMHFLKKSDT